MPAFRDERAQLLGGRVGIPQLHREADDVDRPDLRRVLVHAHRLDVRIAEHARDLQSLLAHGSEVLAARDEVHLVAGRREAGAEVAADAA